MTAQKQAELIEKLQAEHRIIRVLHTEQKVIRCVARQNMPEYNILEGSVFYLVKSDSLGDNWYYIATWNFTTIQWDCRCMATKPCKHNRAVAKDCAKSHTVQGYKPVSKADTFAALVAKYDVRSQQAQAQAQTSVIADAEKVAQEAHNELIRQGAVAETLAQIQEDNRVRANYEQEQARRATAQREAQLRAQAPLNGNRTFSFMR